MFIFHTPQLICFMIIRPNFISSYLRVLGISYFHFFLSESNYLIKVLIRRVEQSNYSIFSQRLSKLSELVIDTMTGEQIGLKYNYKSNIK